MKLSTLTSRVYWNSSSIYQWSFYWLLVLGTTQASHKHAIPRARVASEAEDGYKIICNEGYNMLVEIYTRMPHDVIYVRNLDIDTPAYFRNPSSASSSSAFGKQRVGDEQRDGYICEIRHPSASSDVVKLNISFTEKTLDCGNGIIKVIGDRVLRRLQHQRAVLQIIVESYVSTRTESPDDVSEEEALHSSHTDGIISQRRRRSKFIIESPCLQQYQQRSEIAPALFPVIDGKGRKTPLFKANKQTDLVGEKAIDAVAVQRRRRGVLPDDFNEDQQVGIDVVSTTVVEGNAPEPRLSVSVRQGAQLIDDHLSVKPGTPLTMQIALDERSAPIYGLLVSYMEVSDGQNRAKVEQTANGTTMHKAVTEAVIFNGCSVDAFLFEDFNTVDGDSLTAKFRAFKFPSSSSVQFTGIVDVCLDKCEPAVCNNGRAGYGRKKRRRRRRRSAVMKNNNTKNDDESSSFLVSLQQQQVMPRKNQWKRGAAVFRVTLTTHINVDGGSTGHSATDNAVH